MANILWVEDEAEKLEGLIKPLKKAGHHFVIAENVKEAIDKLEKGKYDLIILDIIMPFDNSDAEIDFEKSERYAGVALLKRIRKHSETQDTPILVLTVVDDDRVLTEIRNIGVSMIVRKATYLPSELKRDVYKILHIKD